jgi:hypothetical protein
VGRRPAGRRTRAARGDQNQEVDRRSRSATDARLVEGATPRLGVAEEAWRLRLDATLGRLPGTREACRWTQGATERRLEAHKAMGKLDLGGHFEVGWSRVFGSQVEAKM